MRIYEQINALPPAGIGKKSAHIIGGGIGGLSAFAYKSVAVVASTILGIAVAVALARPFAETKGGKFLEAANFDVSGSQSDIECPKITWPYGCEWRPPVGSPTKRFLVQRRGSHYRLPVAVISAQPLTPSDL